MRAMTSAALPPIPMVYGRVEGDIAVEEPTEFTELELPPAPGIAPEAEKVVVAFPSVEPKAAVLERTAVYGACVFFSLGCWATALSLVRVLSRHL